MRKSLLVSCLLAASALTARAENPLVLKIATPDDDMAGTAVVDSAGNYYVSGMFTVASVSQLGVAKFNAQGQLLWQARYSGAAGGESSGARHIALDNAGNVVVTGFVSFPAPIFQRIVDVLTVKFSANGQELWARTFAGRDSGFDAGARVLADAVGNIFVGGTSAEDWLLLKYDSNGGLLWSTYIGAPTVVDHFADMALGSDNALVLTGRRDRNAPQTDIRLAAVKIDATSGNALWDVEYVHPTLRDAAPSDLVLDAGNNALITGGASINFHSAENAVIPLTIKFNAAGALQFDLLGEGVGGSSVEPLPDSQFLVVGAIFQDAVDPTFAGLGRASLSKFDANGNRLWTTPLGEPGTEYITHVRALANGNIVVAGTYLQPGGATDYLTRTLTSNGAPLWLHRFNATGASREQVTDLTVDNASRAYVLGQSSDNAQMRDDVLALRFDAQGTPRALLLPPASLSIGAISRTSIGLRWTDTNGDETGIAVERCTGSNCTNFVEVARLPANSVSFTSNGLSRRTTYRFRVRALRNTDASAYSNVVQATTSR